MNDSEFSRVGMISLRSISGVTLDRYAVVPTPTVDGPSTYNML